ncbi:hypothetical protein ACCT25_35860, partial [Rhizobium ruizarguesonis]
MDLDEKWLTDEELNAIRTKADFFRFLLRKLLPNTEPTAEAAMELFSWAIDIESGTFETQLSTFKSWMRDQKPGGFETKKAPNSKFKISVVQHFSRKLATRGFQVWGSATDKRPSDEHCKVIAKAINHLLSTSLKLQPRGRSVKTQDEAAISRHATQRISWELPEELNGAFRKSPVNHSSYARFGRSIPYFSRRTFEAETAGIIKSSEFDQFNDFLDDSDRIGFIISGRGGVGKTKLAEQLVTSLDLERWEVFYLSERATSGNISKFVDCIEPSRRYCVLIDYAEETEALFEFAAAVHDKVAEGTLDGLNIKAVATCRTSSMPNLEKRLQRYRHALTQLSLDQLNSDNNNRFLSWVVEKILATHFADDWQAYSRLAAKLPSTAVFFSNLERRRQEYLDNGDIVGAERCSQALRQPSGYETFQAWIDKHLSRTLQAGEWGDDLLTPKELGYRLASIYSVLPERYSALQANGQLSKYVDRLIDDGWLYISREALDNHEQDAL